MADHPMSDPDSIALGWCVDHSRCGCSGAHHAAQFELSGGRSLPCPSSRPEIPTNQESTCNRAVIPPVLPCCVHIKREHHPIPDGHVGSLFIVQAAEQTARPKSGPRRRLGITSDRCQSNR